MNYKVHILRPASLSPGIVEDAFSIIEQSITGPITFKLSSFDYEPHAVDLEHSGYQGSDPELGIFLRATPNYNLFDVQNDFITQWREKEPTPPLPIGERINTVSEVLEDCKQIASRYRQQEGLTGENMVIVCTTRGNTNNFFAEGADKVTPTAMLQINHTVMQGGNPHLLLAYYMAAMPLKGIGFNEVNYIEKYAHFDTRGCMNDLGADDVNHLRIKTKTADICKDCKTILRDKNVPFEFIKQVREIFTLIREIQNHIEDFDNAWTYPGISVGPQITIPEHGKVVKFSPVEKAVYSLFLCIDEGIKYVDIGDYRGKLKDLYGTYYNRSSVAEIDQVVESLCNILEPGRLREAVSKCNKKIKEALGNDFSDQYQIKGPRGGAKRIKLDRSLVKHLEGYEF